MNKKFDFRDKDVSKKEFDLLQNVKKAICSYKKVLLECLDEELTAAAATDKNAALTTRAGALVLEAAISKADVMNEKFYEKVNETFKNAERESVLSSMGV